LNTKRLTLIILLALGALFLSACSGQPLVNTWPGLAADAERAYISSGSFIYAVDLQNGTEVWRYPAEADSKILFFASPILTTDGQLLIGSAGSEHPFVSLNAETGKENWSEPFMGGRGVWVASPLVVDDVIYAPNADGHLYILNLNGKEIADPVKLGGALWSAPVTDGELLYVASLDHHLHIVNPETLKVIGTISIGGAVPASPAISMDGVFVGSFASKVDFVSSAGVSKTVAETGNWIWGTPTLDGETLYYADLEGKLYSLDLSTNRQNWDNVQPNGPVVASPLVVGDQIYVAAEAGTFIALDRDGKIVWEKTPGGKIYTTPVLSGEFLLVAPYQAEFALAAYDLDGKQAWTFTPQK
jgi:outer membrane protein assembly factor BamB